MIYLFLFAFVHHITCQILQAPRSQPVLSVDNSIQKCCLSTGSPIFEQCVGVESATALNIAFVTFSAPGTGQFGIENIDSFGNYQAALVAAYCSQHNYSFHRMDPVTSNYRPDDMRWNKVKILLEALHPINGWARNVEYIVWVDADLIVLDMGLDIQQVSDQYPDAHILASADIRLGMINSGMLICKNTDWLYTFLTRWWSIGNDESSNSGLCDQDAFDLLYQQYINESEDGYDKILVSKAVAILRYDALNSHPPAMLHQQPHNQVLHMMGECSAVREEVFRTAWHNLCVNILENSNDDDNTPPISEGEESRQQQEEKADASYMGTFTTGGRPLPVQLGITKEFIFRKAYDVYQQQTEEQLLRIEAVNTVSVLRELNASLNPDQFDEELTLHIETYQRLLKDLDAASRMAHHLCDIYRAIGTAGALAHEQAIRQHLFYLVGVHVRDLQTGFDSLFGAKTDRTMEVGIVWSCGTVGQYKYTSECMKQWVEVLWALMKRMAESGNDYYHVLSSPEEKRQIANIVLSVLSELLEYTMLDQSMYKEHIGDVATGHTLPLSAKVPIHMAALMHQNVAGDNLQRYHRATAGVVLKQHQHKVLELMKLYLVPAIREANQSIALFSSICHVPDMYPSNNRDSSDCGSSLKDEFITSIQMYQSIDCMLAGTNLLHRASTNAKHQGIQYIVNRENFLEQQRRHQLSWEKALKLASGNVMGMSNQDNLDNQSHFATTYGASVGILSTVLHNAAVCFATVGLLDQSVNLLLRAKALSEHQQVKRDQDTSFQDITALIQRKLMREKVDELWSASDFYVNCGGSAACVGDLLVFDTDADRHDNAADDDVMNDALWEECVEGEEGCEAFDVYEEEEDYQTGSVISEEHHHIESLFGGVEAGQDRHTDRGPDSSSNVDSNVDKYDDDEYDEMEAEAELLDIRERYAAQAKRMEMYRQQHEENAEV